MNWWVRSAIAVCLGGLVLGWLGLALGTAFVLVDRMIPRLTPLLPLLTMLATVVIVLIEGQFVHGNVFVQTRPVAHLLGLATALACIVYVLSRIDLATADHEATPAAEVR